MPPLTRSRQTMPDDIRQELEQSELMGDYLSRPDYQQNDYLAWIARAKRPATQQKRLQQMLDELKRGGVYMKMAHPASAKPQKEIKSYS